MYIIVCIFSLFSNSTQQNGFSIKLTSSFSSGSLNSIRFDIVFLWFTSKTGSQIVKFQGFFVGAVFLLLWMMKENKYQPTCVRLFFLFHSSEHKTTVRRINSRRFSEFHHSKLLKLLKRILIKFDKQIKFPLETLLSASRANKRF